MNNLIYEYTNYLDENSTQNTKMSYLRDLTKFISEMEITRLSDISNLSEDDIGEYIAILKNRGMAYSSLARTVASLRKFFVYCQSRGIVCEDLTKNAEVPRHRRKLPDTISFEEIVRILEAPDISNIKGIRDKAMLEMMYATGAKVSELINLRVNDISLKNEMVVINSGSKHRFVPLGKSAVDSMVLYLKEARRKIPSSDKSDILFLNFYGDPLTRQGFWKIIKQYIEIAGIKGNVTPQTIRHSFALHLLSNGADTRSVSEMMGYSDETSVKIYFDVMNNKIKNVYRKAHPRA